MPQVVKIAVIGDDSVGKTSFIRRFKSSQFRPNPNPEKKSSTPQRPQVIPEIRSPKLAKTNLERWDNEPSSTIQKLVKEKKRCPSSYCSVLFAPPTHCKEDHRVEEQLIDITFLDVPRLEKFPANSLEEWESGDALGVRSAHAFILLYDVTNEKSFSYVDEIRKEIVNTFDPMKSSATDIYQSLTVKRARPKLLQNSPKLEADSGSEGSTFGFWKTRFSKNSSLKHSRVTQHIGTSLYSASFAQPAISMKESFKERSSKCPLVVVVGNKRDLFEAHYDDRHRFIVPCRGCHHAASKKIDYCRRVSTTKSQDLTRKTWKCHHFECSVKWDWNVTKVVVEILGSLLSSQTQKCCHLKRLKKRMMGRSRK